MSSGKGLTLVKTTFLPGQERVTVVASLPTNQSCDVTANIPIIIINIIVNYSNINFLKRLLYLQS